MLHPHAPLDGLVEGVHYIVDPGTGRIYPLVAGGDGTGDKPDPEPDPDKPDPTGDKPDPEPDHAAEAAKWKALARKHEGTAKANADAAKKLKELEDKDKTESQKLADELAAAKADGTQSAASLLRLEVALDKAPDDLSAADVRKYAKRLQGSTREELEADAEEFFESFGGSTDSGDRGKPASRKPKERLRGGGDPEDDPEPDIDKVVAKIPRL